MVAPRHPSGRTRRKVEDNRTGHQELLVARSNKRSGEIRGWMQCLLEIQKPKRSTSRKADA